MATDVIMPALGMAQETGILIQWLKEPGDAVKAGEPLMEIETDKATVEVEAAASGVLANVSAQAGDEVPVGQVIAVILEAGEQVAAPMPVSQEASTAEVAASPEREAHRAASPLAARIATEHNVDLDLVPAEGRRVSKADVLAYIETRQPGGNGQGAAAAARLVPATPKARRLAQERELSLAAIAGTGPDGAVLAQDVLNHVSTAGPKPTPAVETASLAISNTWRVMVERLTAAWPATPHFYLTREVDATEFITWREAAQARTEEKITYTDLLVRAATAALKEHPGVNASWADDGIQLHPAINVGLAVAIDTGLVVPVVHQADTLTLPGIAARRKEIVERAQAGSLKLDDLQGGTFTISNLGMYGVDAFNAVVNPPQAAILAVGRIADRVVAIDKQPVVRPIMVLTLSIDHRVVDGARGAQFLDTLVRTIEQPLRLID